ncbi:MAG: aspartate ammonia-lyase [Lautropia sp.]
MSSSPGPVRTEKDSIGLVEIGEDDLRGINAIRGERNFRLSGTPFGAEREFVKSFGLCKWAAALANRDLGVVSAARSEAIVAACREVVEGRLDRFMRVDVLEGSGGTSTNMAVNEVIANRALQIMGKCAGSYQSIHPNDHVNRSQSTNDVYPSAMKIAAYIKLDDLLQALQVLDRSFDMKSEAFSRVLHLGRTCLQDAQPMTLGQLFSGYAGLCRRLGRSLKAIQEELTVLPLGGTAIGTGFGSPPNYKQTVFERLREISGIAFISATNPFDAMQNLDVFSRLSAELRTCATSLAKICSDLILLSSGPAGGLGEIRLPAVQTGSSMMPGKVNPVIPMAFVQIGFAVVGNDTCIAQANQNGQLEINHFEPVVAHRLFDSIRLLTNGIRAVAEQCVSGITADIDVNERNLLGSPAISTAFIERLGYEPTATIVREALEEGVSLVSKLQAMGLMSLEESVQLIRKTAEVVR